MTPAPILLMCFILLGAINADRITFAADHLDLAVPMGGGTVLNEVREARLSLMLGQHCLHMLELSIDI